MASFTYNGEQELEFPTLGAVVKKGESIEAPDDFAHPAFSAAKGKPAPTKTLEEVTE